MQDQSKALSPVPQHFNLFARLLYLLMIALPLAGQRARLATGPSSSWMDGHCLPSSLKTRCSMPGCGWSMP